MSERPKARRESSGGTERSELSTTNRRRFLGGLGASAVAGLAGCLGSVPGLGGGKPTVNMVTFPLDVDGLVAQYIKNEGVMEEEMSNAGYDWELQMTFEGLPQFLSGNAQIAGLGGIEAARLAIEREMNLVNFAVRSWMYLGMLVKTGSKWDPENTGSVEATIEKVASEGGKIGIGGWSFGNVPVDQIILEQGFDKEMAEGGGDVRVVTAELPSLPSLAAKGDVAMASSSPTHGAAGQLVNDELKPLYWGHDMLNSLGFGTPPLGGLGCRKEFYDQEPEAVEACLRAWNRGFNWFFENGLEEVPPDKDKRERLGTTSEEQARFAIPWVKHAEGVKYRSRIPPRSKDIANNEEKTNQVMTFLEATENAGMLESGWDEYFEMIEI